MDRGTRRAAKAQLVAEMLQGSSWQALIACVYAAVGNGDLEARIPLGSENILWQIAMPLNHLLNRFQHWKGNSDLFERTVKADRYVTQKMQRARVQQTPMLF